jgi:hypothetical protein
MTALGVLSLCATRGVKLVLEGGDRITLEGPQTARDQVRETIRAVKPEVVSLLRAGRQTEVSRFRGSVRQNLCPVPRCAGGHLVETGDDGAPRPGACHRRCRAGSGCGGGCLPAGHGPGLRAVPGLPGELGANMGRGHCGSHLPCVLGLWTDGRHGLDHDGHRAVLQGLPAARTAEHGEGSAPRCLKPPAPVKPVLAAAVSRGTTPIS